MRLGKKLKLEGERIYLRDLNPRDVTEAYQSWLADPQVNQFLESSGTYSLTELKAFVTKNLKSKTAYFFAIVEKSKGRHIGNIKLDAIDWKHCHGTVGILIGEKTAWGKGFGSEAIRLVTQFAFSDLELNKVRAGVLGENKGSLAAFKKAGFEIAGVLKQHFRHGDRFYDDVLFESLNPKR